MVFGGGAGGAKTNLGCNWAVINCLKWAGCRGLIGREELTKLKKSTLLSLFDVMAENGLKRDVHYTVNMQDNFIKFWNGSALYFMELKETPSDPNFERIGSTEFTFAFIDEAAEISEKAKDVVASRLRYKLDKFGTIGKILMTCNPAKNWIYKNYYKPWRDNSLPVGSMFIQALAIDNPYLPASYREALLKIKDRVTRERLAKGNWEYEDNDLALFKIDDITDIFTNTVDLQFDDDGKYTGEKYIIGDVARLGRDKSVIGVWRALECYEIHEFAKNRINELAKFIRQIQKRERIPNSNTLLDEDGVGGGAVDMLECKGFVGNSRPIRDEQQELDQEFKVNYANLRSQCYYESSYLVSDHKLAIKTEDVSVQGWIMEELESIKAKDVGKDKPLAVGSKDDIKKDIGRSPDYSDMIMMRTWFELQPIEVNITFV